MTNMTKRQFKNERNLHKLFATNLPVVPIPADFAEHLVQSVLEEVALHQQNRAVGGEHRVRAIAKPAPPRRRLRVKRPPQALLLGIVCLWVSLLFLMSGCTTARPTVTALAQRSPGVVAQPPLAPLLPQLPVAAVRAHTPAALMMTTAVSATQPVTMAVLQASGYVSDAAPVSQITGVVLVDGEIAQEAAAQATLVATATSPPPEVATPPPTTVPATATASPPAPTPTASPLATTPSPQLNPFLPTATPIPPTATESMLPLPSHTPQLQPLPPTPTAG